MKILSVIQKSFREQIRNFWVLLLTLSMGPFFIFVYYLILESSKPVYKILIVNEDTGITTNGKSLNYGNALVEFCNSSRIDSLAIPFRISQINDTTEGIGKLKNKHADALIVIPEDFSSCLSENSGNSLSPAHLKFYGDLTNTNYLISAIWAFETATEYTVEATGRQRVLELEEIALGSSASISDFDLIVPGILILSLILLMFTASIAFVQEVEHHTILRLKLSRLTALEFIGGISVVQLFVGIFSVVLTLVTSVALGFQFKGSLAIMIFVAGLTSLSLIAFSIIIAAATRSANEVLVVGNFPMFLFMFFTGAAFPMKSKALFSIAGYPVSVQGLMTPTHAISALNKTLVLDMDLASIIPEIIAILVLTLVYFLIGALLFRRRHLRVG